MAPFRWPTTSNDIMLATEAAVRKPKYPADWETIVGILIQAFSSDNKQVDLSGRACRERVTNKFVLQISSKKRTRNL